MLASLPLLIIPFILYNIGLAGIFGTGTAGPWDNVLFSFQMMSGGTFSMTLGILMIGIALVLFFIEIVKSTRAKSSVVDHLLSTFVFVAYLVEFLLVEGAATSVFFILLLISLIDVLAGFSVSIRAAQRDVTVT